MKNLIVNELTSGTATNVEAYPLFLAMKSCAEKSEAFALSFRNVEFTSSSFLNSSIGAFIDSYSYDVFAKSVKFTDCTHGLAAFVKDYVLKYKSIIKS